MGLELRYEGFKALLVYARMEGALKITMDLVNSHKAEISGLSEHLYAFNWSGISQILDSNKCGCNSPLRTAKKE